MTSIFQLKPGIQRKPLPLLLLQKPESILKPKESFFLLNPPLKSTDSEKNQESGYKSTFSSLTSKPKLITGSEMRQSESTLLLKSPSQLLLLMVKPELMLFTLNGKSESKIKLLPSRLILEDSSKLNPSDSTSGLFYKSNSSRMPLMLKLNKPELTSTTKWLSPSRDSVPSLLTRFQSRLRQSEKKLTLLSSISEKHAESKFTTSKFQSVPD